MGTIGRLVPGSICTALLLLGVPAYIAAQVTFTVNQEAPFAAIPKSQDEFDAFQAVRQEMDPETRVELANDFLSDFADSEYRHVILRFRFQSLYDLGDWEQTVASIEEGLVAEDAFREGKLGLLENPEELADWPAFQLDMANQRMVYYQSLAEGYQELGELDDALMYAEMTLDAQDAAWSLFEAQNDPSTPEFAEARERQDANREFVLRGIYRIQVDRGNVPAILDAALAVLEVVPGDVEMLMRVSQIMSSEAPEDPAARAAHFEEAEVYASEAITALEEWAQSDASAGLSQEQKDGLRAQAYSIMGMIHFQTQDFAAAAEAFSEATRMTPEDPTYHYQLGVAYNNSQNAEGALTSLARAVYLGFDQGRAALESVYKATHDGSLDGLDEFVEASGQQLDQ